MENSEQSMRLFKYINSDFRLRLVLLLNCYEELTMKQICKKLNKSKVTITNHLKGLSDIGILKVREESLKGPLLRKYYSVDPFSYLKTITKSEDFLSLSDEKKWEYLMQKADFKRSEFEFMQNFITQIIPYWTNLQNKMKEYQEARAEYSENSSLDKNT